MHVCADPYDPIFVEVKQALFTDVGDVARDLLGAQLGVTGLDFVLLNVNRCELVVPGHGLRDDDGVLEVIAFPAHEGAEQRLSERQLAGIGRRGIGKRLAGSHAITPAHERTVVDAGPLVGSNKLAERVAALASVIVKDCYMGLSAR